MKSKDQQLLEALGLLGRRDQLLFGGAHPNYCGGTAQFKGINLKTLKELQRIGCLDPMDSFNCSPETGEFMDFMEPYPNNQRRLGLRRHPGFTAHGYAYRIDRFEEVGGILHSIAIEGIELRAPKIDWQTTQDFVMAFRCATDFEWEPDHLYCWYD
jgi:hypothetical protein